MGVNENECTVNVSDVYNLLQLPQLSGGFINMGYIEPGSDETTSAWSIEFFYNLSTLVVASPTPTTTSFGVSGISIMQTGMEIEINVGGTYYTRTIASVAGSTITITSALPSQPSVGATVRKQWWQFNTWLETPSMHIEKNYGERSSFNFRIANRGQLPFIPQPEMRVRIMNISKSYVYIKGFVKTALPSFIRTLSNWTEYQILNVDCYDLYRDLERRLINKVYVNQTLGAILRDVIRTYTSFDHTAIDGTAGPIQTRFAINNQNASQVLTRILSQMQWTYWIDYDSERLYVGELGYSSQLLASITDQSIQERFINNKIDIQTNYEGIQTVIVMNWTQKYATGTCNVANGSPIVFGVDTFWDNISVDDLKFQVDGNTSVYSVSKNNSNGVTQELRLSGDYQEGTETAVGYTLFGSRKRRSFRNESAIHIMSQLNGNDGLYEYSHTEDQNAYTDAEIVQIAQALMTITGPKAKGKGTTNNHLFPCTGVEPGKVINFNTPSSKRYVGQTIIFQVVIEDIAGSPVTDTDGNIYPLIEYEFDFTHNLFQARSILRKLMFDVRRVLVADEDTVEQEIFISDTSIANDCIHWRSNLQIILGYTELNHVLSYYTQCWTAGTAEDSPMVADGMWLLDSLETRTFDWVAPYTEFSYVFGYDSLTYTAG